MKRQIAKCAVFSVVCLANCAVAPTQPVQLVNSFNADEIAWSNAEGQNKLEGSALLRQQGGGVVTCAGTEVHLSAYSAYSAERIRYVYGRDTGGYADWGSFAFRARLPVDEAYLSSARVTVCDAQGKFKFSNLPDGEYYVTTQVSWSVGYSPQGGYLAQRVSLAGGETKEVVLTSN